MNPCYTYLKTVRCSKWTPFIPTWKPFAVQNESLLYLPENCSQFKMNPCNTYLKTVRSSKWTPVIPTWKPFAVQNEPLLYLPENRSQFPVIPTRKPFAVQNEPLLYLPENHSQFKMDPFYSYLFFLSKQCKSVILNGIGGVDFRPRIFFQLDCHHMLFCNLHEVRYKIWKDKPISKGATFGP